jgi:hypothetical protein
LEPAGEGHLRDRRELRSAGRLAVRRKGRGAL